MRGTIIAVVLIIGVGVTGTLLWKTGRRVSKSTVIGGGVATWSASGGLPGAPPVPPIDKEFQEWLQNVAKDVDATHIDNVQKRYEIAKVLSVLTEEQTRQLLQTAQAPSSTSGERVLAAYLMIEAWPKAANELMTLITAPVTPPQPNDDKEVAELRAGQERSVRALAIDGLISHAEKDPKAKEVLAKSIPNIPDEYIKKYAEKRMTELK